MPEILVVDDEPGIRELMREILEEEGYEVRMAENGSRARAALDDKNPDLILLDIWMPDVDGVTLLKEWRGQGRLTMPVVMMSGHGTVHTAVEATRLGAFDYLEKPIAYKQLLDTVKKALASRQAKPTTSGTLEELGSGESVKRLAQRLGLAASAGLPVLLLAEPGTGEEVAARFLTPPDAPFVRVDDPAELANRPADLLARAKGGLVYVPDLTSLTVMQQRGLILLIARRAEFAARVVAVIRVAPAQALAEGRLTAELHEALAHAVVDLPPLRARGEDIPGLAARALEAACVRLRLPPLKFTDAAMSRLAEHDWPGNLVELDTLTGRLALDDGVGPIDLDAIDAALGPRAGKEKTGVELMLNLPLKDARDAFEKAYLEALLAACDWGMSRAAERAGLDRTNLYRKVKQLGIEAPGKEK
ncbi:MAG: sigma-54 dependent transcriptional regulator [Pseudomonadota bacterium]|nr:sigma-54 dependent transcriptional regulator [Pseudomonadota bacterium]MDP1905313.1 sigma-54 dependent transcriptional regulator [Pseudomonadota bacterium]MDP2353865.1 sigma-54 dependent transcriptional regulator [Pseudomonadota bacterium]